jgi:hypothetical protein
MAGDSAALLTRLELKILRHIVANNGAGQLKTKRQRRICIYLYKKGFLERRIGDFEWIWNGKKYE